MDKPRFHEIAAGFGDLRIAVVGDFCLDRYLEIDPGKSETSIETGLEVYNVVNVRSQPGGAGTILSNLVDLGIGLVVPVGFCGCDGEGSELRGALAQLGNRVNLTHFVESGERRTFTYTKPLVVREGLPPHELNRLDFKNWSPTSKELSLKLAGSIWKLADEVDAFVVLDQVDEIDTGVVTRHVLAAMDQICRSGRCPVVLGDSRAAIDRFPLFPLKVNDSEFCRKLAPGRAARDPRKASESEPDAIKRWVGKVAAGRQSSLFVTLGPGGILCGKSHGDVDHAPAHPVRGTIDIVGAGDAVTANLAAALAAGASNREAMEIAMASASIVIHKVGTTGTATPEEIAELLAD